MHSDKVKNKFYYNLLLILVSFGIIYFFIYPMYSGSGQIYSPKKGIKDLLQEKRDITSAINIVEDYDNKLSSANKVYTASLNNLPLEELNKILPTSADPVLIAYEITNIGSKSNMLLSGLSVNASQGSNNKYNTMTINFSTEGSYANLRSFLHNLEISQRIYNVTSLSFSSAQDSLNSSVYKYSFTVETYYLLSDKDNN